MSFVLHSTEEMQRMTFLKACKFYYSDFAFAQMSDTIKKSKEIPTKFDNLLWDQLLCHQAEIVYDMPSLKPSQAFAHLQKHLHLKKQSALNQLFTYFQVFVDHCTFQLPMLHNLLALGP